MQTELHLPGIQILTEIGRGAHSTVYKATRNGRPFAVKVLRSSTADMAEAAIRFRREAGVMARVRHPGLARIMEVGEVHERPYLVMEYVEGRTLAPLIEKGPLPERQIRYLAKTLAGALAEVHRRGLVHRDVKPANILLDEADNAKLIDFGFAMQATDEQQMAEFVGTFLYSSPEQSGMLRRPVDGRTDLYALGVVLFECATGQPPFMAGEVGQLIQQHAVMAPPDIHELNPDISPGLVAIILKLLAKDPDDRYQTGEGLIADLDKINALNSALKAGQKALLGSKDDRFSTVYETPLIGRDQELADLQQLWQQALKGHGQAALAVGEAGSGKSRLVRELLHGAQASGALVMVGRCVEANPLPFGPLREAVEGLLRYLPQQPELQQQKIEKQVRTAVGQYGPLLKRFSPLLATMLDDVPDAPEMDDAQNQFLDAVADFIQQLAVTFGAAVLFLDNVQWLDDASRRVLRRLVNAVGEAPLFIIAASQEESVELDDAPDQAAAPARLQLFNHPDYFYEIDLGGLSEDAVARLVAAYLGGHQLEQSIVQQLTVRSNGNPFAVEAYLRAMIDAGLLRPSWGNWLANTEGLDKLQISGDVMQFIVDRLDDLSERARRILVAAAIIGARFSFDLLLAVHEEDDEVIQEAIAEAVANRMIEQEEGDHYLFVHEQVREALLVELEPAKKEAFHRRIAQAIDQQSGSTAQTEEHVYLLAQHYALGATPELADRVYETNFAAGKLAIENFAYEEAYRFLRQAAQAQEHDHRPGAPELDELLANVCFWTGRPSEAEKHALQGLEHTKDSLRQARLWRRLAHVHLSTRNNKKGWQAISNAFSALGLSVPEVSAKSLLKTAGQWMRWTIADRWNIGYGESDPEEKVRLRDISKLYEVGGYLAYMSSNSLLLLQFGILPLLPGHRLGPSRELAHAYGGYSILLSVLGRKEAAEKYIAKAEQVSRKINNLVGLGHTAYINAMVNHIGGDSQKAARRGRGGLENYGRWLNSFDFGAASGDLALNLLMRGYVRDAWHWVEKVFQRAELSGNPQDQPFYPYAASILAVLGHMGEAEKHLAQVEERIGDKVEASNTYRWSLLLGHQILVYLEQGRLDERLETAVERQRQLNIRPDRATFQLRFFYVFQVYARLRQGWEAQEDKQQVDLAVLRAALEELEATASTPVLQGHYLVGCGGEAYLDGRYAEALDFLAEAERLAVEADNPWGLFEVARWRAYTLQAQNSQLMAEQQARIAYHIALDHHWPNRARLIRQQFPLSDSAQTLGSGGTSRSLSVSSKNYSTDASSIRLERYLDALLQVSLASAAFLDPDLQAQAALDEIVRILGAERAFLFTIDPEQQEPVFRAGRDAQEQDLAEQEGYSETVIRQVLAREEPIILSGTEEGALLGSASVVARDIRSILAAPLMLRDQLVGIVYLDNRLVTGVFTAEDVQILLAIGNHIAISLEITRMIEVIQERTEALQNAYLQLERLDRTKSDFISITSHELRTPLTVLDGYCQVLLSDPSIKQNDYHFQLVSGIRKGAIRLHEIINNMLDMAKLDSRTLRLYPEEVALGELLEDVTYSFEDSLAEREITLDFRQQSFKELPPIEADPDALKKVFYHLIVNAIKYTPNGGQVTIDGRYLEDGDSPFTGDAVQVSISDTGIGIDVEYQDLVFTKFYQTGEVALHSTGKTKFKGGGPGLGLTITKGIVEAHSGQIWVESPGYDEENYPGSKFYINLPRQQPDLATEEELDEVEVG